MSSLCRRCWRRGVQMPPPRPPIQARSAWHRIDIYSMAAGIHNPKHWKPKQLLHVLDTLQNNVEASTLRDARIITLIYSLDMSQSFPLVLFSLSRGMSSLYPCQPTSMFETEERLDYPSWLTFTFP
ncbi:hypothetical protein CIHG_01831 [Coccidioides immitis H538.4]|uniref:Uncharacterized protein n=3 Tax=Coccidioides immitis TaxID=5501 RepID=A0A0J8R5B3_COCIT|nr:hypothetical protein CIRG_06153 [Coccidioides immitis RMSCC 2394]KMU80314.1 hypothetical protein CISG_02165 [Coccidioides immitis RMSCC 3703]KMU84045.1 hypothetical protein CIHG_01831 [Coccidioides immitis H538.4]